MRTLALTNVLNWPAIVAEVEQTKEPIALAFEGQVCGFVVLPETAAKLMPRLERTPSPVVDKANVQSSELPNYLDLLRSDPTQTPVVDGERLEFMTMMNSSYVDPEQLYQFRHPHTHRIYVYRESELQEAIGRSFRPVAFIPVNPREYVLSGGTSQP